MLDPFQLQLAGRRQCEVCKQMVVAVRTRPVEDAPWICMVCGTRFPDETDEPQT